MFPAEWGAQPSNFFKRHYIPQHSSSTFSLRMRYTRMLDSNPNCIANCPFIVDDNVTSENCALSSCYYELWLRRRVSKPLNCAFFYTRNAKHDEICDPDVVVRKYDQITDPDLNGTKVRGPTMGNGIFTNNYCWCIIIIFVFIMILLFIITVSKLIINYNWIINLLIIKT